MTRSRRHRPKIRVIALAAVCCVALLALSAPAFASPSTGPVNVPAASHSSPVIRSGDVPSLRVPDPAKVVSATAPAFRAGDVASTRVPDPTLARVSTPFVLRTVVQDDGSQTLAIVLAGSALGIALAGAGFALLRTRMPKAAGLH